MLLTSSVMIAKTVSDLDSRNAGSTLSEFYFHDKIKADSRRCLVLGEVSIYYIRLSKERERF